MSQFVLCIEDKPVEVNAPFLRVSIEEDNFLSGVATDVFPETEKKNIFTVAALNGKPFDSICTAAQVDLAEGKQFSDTELFLCLGWLLESSSNLVLWYGRDYDDLDCVYDRQSLLKKTEDAVVDSSCELYVRYEGAS